MHRKNNPTNENLEAIQEGGWIKLWRKTLSSKVFTNDGLLKTWIWCLLKANHKPEWVSIKTGKGSTEIYIDTGQFVYGRHEAARQLSTSPSTVRNRIEKLRNMQNLDIQKTAHYSIISICNWEQYQVIGQAEDNQRTTKGQPKDTYKKDKKDKKDKEDIYIVEKSKIVLAYLNEKTGKAFRRTEEIQARLRGDGTVDQCKKIIDTKLQDPYFQENPQYYSPTTLFRKSNWDKYLNQDPIDFRAKADNDDWKRRFLGSN